MSNRLIIFPLLICLVASLKLEASCCSSASTGGTPRLLAHERALVEMSLNSRYVYGSFDSFGSVSFGHIAHLPHLIFEPELVVMARVIDFFEPFVKLPVRIQKSDIRTGANPADMSFGARIPLFKENTFNHWPGVTLLTTVRAPTGTSFVAGQNIHNENITGMGKWLIAVGLMLEKQFSSLTYGLGYSFAFEPSFFNVKASTGPIHSPLMTMGFSVHEHGSLSLSLAGAFHGPSKIQSRSVKNSDRRKVTVGAAYGLSLHSHVKVTLQIGTDIPISSIGKDYNSELFLRLGLRFGVF